MRTVPDPSPSSDPSSTATETVATGLTCPVCGTQAAAGDRFCEVDGTALDGSGHACVDGGDGFCSTCGMKMPAPTEVTAPRADVAAATHVGRSHDVDEDAIAVGWRDREGATAYALVVCDGVTSSSHGELASRHAADAALATLLAAAETGTDPAAAVRGAAVAAHRAACTADIPAVEGKDPPGTTFVAAFSSGGRIDVSWVGDSRAFLVAGGAALALTHDHSWVNLVVDSGQMTEAEAMRSPYAHAITHCIGPLEDPDPEKAPEPGVGHVEATPGSRLVLCSDGLWNYAPSPEEIASLVASVPADADAAALATSLVDHALAMGGHDDVSVAVAFL